VFILMILALAIGGALTLYAIRAPALKGGGLFAPMSREGALVLNNLLLTTACATVFLGTMYPLFLDAMGGGKVSVGPPYFNATFVPLMVPLIAAMAVGPMLAWKRGDLAGALGRLRAAIVVTIVIVLATLYARFGGPILALLGMGLAAWLAAGVVEELAERIRLFRAPLAESLRRATHLPRAAWGMSIAHLGMAVTVAGITATSAWQTERITLMKTGEAVDVAGYSFTFRGVREHQGPNYVTRRGTLHVTRDGAFVATLTPEKRFYPVQGQATTEAAIHTNWLADIYVALGDPEGAAGVGQNPTSARDLLPTTAWTVRIYHNPLVPWIWIGAIIMVIGGGLSLSDRRLRIGAPRRAVRPVAAPAPAQA
jgi:cytochrome c-type biogenesis protein CcmF